MIKIKNQSNSSNVIMENNTTCEASYTLVKEIDDSGVFSLVSKVVEINSNKQYAIKKYIDTYDMCPFAFELECFSLVCPYIVRGKDILEISTKTSETVGIILDLAKGTGKWLVNLPQISWEERRMLLTEAIIALHYLHKCNILHLDVKPDNFLIFQDNDSVYRMKLTDFSLSIQIPRNKKYVPFDRDRIPEAFTPPEFDKKEYNLKHDVWAFGLSLLYMSVSASSFKKKYNKVLHDHDISELIKELCEMNEDKTFVDLIEHILDKNPITRYSMDDVIKHKFTVEGLKSLNYKVAYPISSYEKALESSHNTTQKFHKWCETKGIEQDVLDLASIILSENNTLLEKMFIRKYDEKFKLMMKWAVVLSLSRELIENNVDTGNMISELFTNKRDVDYFSAIILELKLNFICAKYQLVYEGKEQGFLHLDW